MPEPKNAAGPQLIKHRNRRGWSQEKFAAKCQLDGWDVSRDIIARIELQIRQVTDI
jgi:transcriptional regulator with XRE-family HTH domain